MRSIITILFPICLFLFSCLQKEHIIRDSNKIVIYFRDGDSVYNYQDTSKKVVKDFTKVLNGKKEKRKCPTEGEIRFYLNDSALFVAGFSISGGENGCQFLMAGDDAWRLTYNTGMYLSETLTEIRKENERNRKYK